MGRNMFCCSVPAAVPPMLDPLLEPSEQDPAEHVLLEACAGQADLAEPAETQLERPCSVQEERGAAQVER